MEAALAQLISMGFPSDLATRALLDANGDVNQAAEMYILLRNTYNDGKPTQFEDVAIGRSDIGSIFVSIAATRHP